MMSEHARTLVTACVCMFAVALGPVVWFFLTAFEIDLYPPQEDPA